MLVIVLVCKYTDKLPYPARPVRPTRWTYSSMFRGKSTLKTWVMSWTSSPRDARSVATRIRTRPVETIRNHCYSLLEEVKPYFSTSSFHLLSLKSLRASSRSHCSRSPWRLCTARPCRHRSLDRSSALRAHARTDTNKGYWLVKVLHTIASFNVW